MIQINLLPKELRVKKRVRKAVSFTLPVIPIASAVVCVTFLIHIALGILLHLTSARIETLNAEWESLLPAKKDFDTISSEKKKLESALKFVKKISETEINWSELLSGLSEAATPDMWLSRMSLESRGKAFNYKNTSENPTRLVLTGHVVGKSEAATAGVGRFITSLKTTDGFFKYFDEVELIDMKTSPVSGEDTMFFRLRCELKRKAEEKAPTKKRVKRARR